jgi:iron(III) transport system ATP-binding protein
MESVTARYRGARRDALSDVTLALGRGEVTALVGASGSGKTTALRLVAGFETPRAGSIEIAGRRVAGSGTAVPPERRGVGMVFQDQALFPHLTVGDNVAFGLEERQAQAVRRRVREVLELLGVADLQGRFPHELSGGQMQRVAIARALAPRPGLILLDEPFNNLDAPLRRRLAQDLREVLGGAGVSAVLVTHDADEAFALASRIVFLAAGRVLQQGRPRKLYETPVHAEVARFFGPVNVIPARRAGTGCDTALGHVPHVRRAPPVEPPVGRPVGPPVAAAAAAAGAGEADCELLVRPDALAPADTGDARGLLRVRGRVHGVTFRGSYNEVLVEPEPADPTRAAPKLLDVHVPSTVNDHRRDYAAGMPIELVLHAPPVCAAGWSLVHTHT